MNAEWSWIILYLAFQVSTWTEGFSISLKLFQIYTKIAISRKRLVSSTARLPNLKWVRWAGCSTTPLNTIDVQSCRFGPWITGFSVKQWPLIAGLRMLIKILKWRSCSRAPCSVKLRPQTAPLATRSGLAVLALMEQWGSHWQFLDLTVTPEPPEEIDWRIRRESEIWGHVQSAEVTHTSIRETNIESACSSSFQSSHIGRSVTALGFEYTSATGKSHNSLVRSWYTRGLEKPTEAVRTGEKRRAIGISFCISEKYWQLWKLINWRHTISECERAPGITKSSQSCKHEKTWPMPKTSWARQSTLKRPSETLGQIFNGTFCWGMLASKLKNLTKVYNSYIAMLYIDTYLRANKTQVQRRICSILCILYHRMRPHHNKQPSCLPSHASRLLRQN